VFRNDGRASELDLADDLHDDMHCTVARPSAVRKRVEQRAPLT
jgi:hypothetical protein